MRTVKRRPRFRVFLTAFAFCAGLVMLACRSALGQTTNSWTSPTSAAWEAPYWSLGVLPSPDQTVAITNGGNKEIEISSSTVANYPASLTVSNLFIEAPTKASSTVLLNHTGLITPLHVLNGCSIATNGTLMNLDGSLDVDGLNRGTFEIVGGTFVQERGLTVVRVPANVWSGTMNLTNASAKFDGLSLSFSSWFNHSGGNVLCGYLRINGAYNLYNGVLRTTNGMDLSSSEASFYQGGGTNVGERYIFVDGDYRLLDGVLQTPLFIIAPGQLNQSGGLVSVEELRVLTDGYLYPPPLPNYLLTDGVLRSGKITVGWNGVFYQSGGEVIATNVFLVTGLYYVEPHAGDYIYHADYSMTGGRIVTPSLSVGEYATFTQAGGTNAVTGDFAVTSMGLYSMMDGLLLTTNSGIGPGAAFTQSNGEHVVSGVLSITGDYDLLGGTLATSGIWLHGRLTVAAPPVFTSSGLLDFGGTLSVSGSPMLGRIKLSSNAVIEFGGASSVVRFLTSRSIAWNPAATLTVTNWNGLVSGGGSNQIYFGSDQTGLNEEQLRRIRFYNPYGVLPGYYPAQLLTTGELVPLVANRPAVLGWGGAGSYGLFPHELDYPETARDVIALASRAGQNIALRADGSVVIWPDRAGQFSTNLPPLTNVAAVSMGYSYALIAYKDGTAAAFGPQVDYYGLTTAAKSLTSVAAVAAGGGHYLALRSDGSIGAWGDSYYGQTNVPSSAQPAVAIACGDQHSLALRRDSRVVAWGWDGNGQCNVPPTLSNAVAIAAGSRFSLALRSDGSVIAWGANDLGQCNVPPSLKDVVSISAGADFALALKADGSVVAWGDNSYGQTTVPAWATNIVQITAGDMYSLVVPEGGIRLHGSLSGAALMPSPLNANETWFTANVPSRSGQTLRLEYAGSLNQANWTPLPLFAGWPAQTTLTDFFPVALNRFYRVRQW